MISILHEGGHNRWSLWSKRQVVEGHDPELTKILVSVIYHIMCKGLELS